MSDDKAVGIEPDETLATSTADPVHNPAGDGIEVSDAAAAQGGTRTGMVKVLGASIALVVLILFGLYFFHLGPLSTNRGAGGQSGLTSQSQAEQFHAAPPSPKQAPPGAPSMTQAPAQ